MEKPSRALQTLNLVTAVLMVIATAMVFLYAPREVTMGEVQRVFYFHVPSAWVGMVAFAVTFVMGILYLRDGNPRWDRIGRSSVEIGLIFTITAGSLFFILYARSQYHFIPIRDYKHFLEKAEV